MNKILINLIFLCIFGTANVHAVEVLITDKNWIGSLLPDGHKRVIIEITEDNPVSSQVLPLNGQVPEGTSYYYFSKWEGLFIIRGRDENGNEAFCLRQERDEGIERYNALVAMIESIRKGSRLEFTVVQNDPNSYATVCQNIGVEEYRFGSP